MANLRSGKALRCCILLISFVFTIACSTQYKEYEGSDFTFSAPAGYKTELYDPPYTGVDFQGLNPNSEMLLFSNVGHYPFFVIYRQKIPRESDLDTVFAVYSSKANETAPHFQFMSQNTITLNGRTAIEYMHCEYLGEPYVQTREIWMEYDGWAYSLVCVHPGNGPSCATIPISDQCINLAEGFKFK